MNTCIEVTPGDGAAECQDVISVRDRQDPLRAAYRRVPSEAAIIDRARTVDSECYDPFHGRVVAGPPAIGKGISFGIHRAVGGLHDAPNPGDMLCAALAACLDATIRMLANRAGVELTALAVDVRAELDVRGTLMVDKNVPVGFQAIRCDVDLQAAQNTDPRSLRDLLNAAEHCCVVMQTLKKGVNITTGLLHAGHA